MSPLIIIQSMRVVIYLFLPLLIALIIAIVIYRHNRHKSSSKAITALNDLDILNTLEGIDGNYEIELQEKIKNAVNKNNLLQDLIEKKENENQDIKQKIEEGTINSKQEYIRLCTAISNLGLGFIIIDQEKNINFINKFIKTLAPGLESNIKLKDLQMLINEKINFTQAIDDSLNKGKPAAFEDIYINNKYTNLFFSPIISDHENKSKSIGVVIVIEDKTEEKLIKHARKNFFVIASHELRTPLTGIRGYISIIKQFYLEGIKDEQLKRIISDIDASSTRLINIVNEFLETPKSDKENLKTHLVVCDLVEIINSSIKETGSLYLEKNLSLKFNNTMSQAEVLGNKDKIKQILINLISNAVKYTNRGGITIILDKTPSLQYKISVQDTGKGISKDNTEQLFGKFKQADPNQKSKIVSSGLGLYISKLLSEKMGGTLKLENSEEGKGSKFSFSLPVYQKDIANTNTTGVN